MFGKKKQQKQKPSDEQKTGHFKGDSESREKATELFNSIEAKGFSVWCYYMNKDTQGMYRFVYKVTKS